MFGKLVLFLNTLVYTTASFQETSDDSPPRMLEYYIDYLHTVETNGELSQIVYVGDCIKYNNYIPRVELEFNGKINFPVFLLIQVEAFDYFDPMEVHKTQLLYSNRWFNSHSRNFKEEPGVLISKNMQLTKTIASTKFIKNQENNTKQITVYISEDYLIEKIEKLGIGILSAKNSDEIYIKRDGLKGDIRCIMVLGLIEANDWPEAKNKVEDAEYPLREMSLINYSQ